MGQLVHADLELTLRADPVITRQRQHAAAGDGVTVDRGDERVGGREHLDHGGRKAGQEFLEAVAVVLVEGHQVEPGRENSAAAGQHRRLRVTIGKTGGEPVEQFLVHGIGAAELHAGYAHAVALFDDQA